MTGNGRAKKWKLLGRGEAPGREPDDLKFYIHDDPHSFRIELRGSLRSRDIAELEGCWSTAAASVGARRVCVDLRGLAEMDDAGRRWLSLMAQLPNAQILGDGTPADLIAAAHQADGRWTRIFRSKKRAAVAKHGRVTAS